MTIQDYNQWIKETVNQLRERNFNEVDWDNLIEELESMGKSDKRAILSLLTRLLEHLLKLSYWEVEKERSGNHWAAEIVNFRAQIQHHLEDSPSLKPELEAMYAKAYPVAIKSLSLCMSPGLTISTTNRGGNIERRIVLRCDNC